VSYRKVPSMYKHYLLKVFKSEYVETALTCENCRLECFVGSCSVHKKKVKREGLHYFYFILAQVMS